MRASEIRALTGLRAVAALSVLAYHLRQPLRELFPALPASLFSQGYLGVDVFFVLSGFILALHYGGRLRSASDYGAFLGYRLARIYPLHLVLLLAVVIAAHGAGVFGIQIHEAERFALDYHFALHVLLMHAWGFEESLRFNLPAWSISAEFFAYMLFPIAWWIASRVRRRPAFAPLAAACALGGVLVLRLGLGYTDLHVVTHHALIRVSGAFLAGVLMYRLFAAGDAGGTTSGDASGDAAGDEAHAADAAADRPAPMAPAAATLALLAVVAVALSPLADWLMPVAACGLVYVLARGGSPLARPLETPTLLWLGRISFSIYLVHLPVFSLLNRVLPVEAGLPWPVRVAVATTYVGAAIGVAALSYAAIELPARRWMRTGVDRGLRRGGEPTAWTPATEEKPGGAG